MIRLFLCQSAIIYRFLDGAEALDELMRKVLEVEIDSGWTRLPTNIH
ncbi:hypothetical protein ACV339_15950 [Pseudomonas aeruginosa]